MDPATERIATNIRKGVLEFCVLALLARGEKYGLELAHALVERGLTASEGSLYPLLARMREAGAVETRWHHPAGARARRYYEITDTGRAQLQRFASVWHDTTGQVDQLLTADVQAKTQAKTQTKTPAKTPAAASADSLEVAPATTRVAPASHPPVESSKRHQ